MRGTTSDDVVSDRDNEQRDKYLRQTQQTDKHLTDDDDDEGEEEEEEEQKDDDIDDELMDEDEEQDEDEEEDNDEENALLQVGADNDASSVLTREADNVDFIFPDPERDQDPSEQRVRTFIEGLDIEQLMKLLEPVRSRLISTDTVLQMSIQPMIKTADDDEKR